MAQIVISEFMEPEAVEDLGGDFDVCYDPTLFERPDGLCTLLAPARALIVRNRTEVRGAVLAAGPRLEAIGRLGVGIDNIDVAACSARGIKVLPATGANDLSVAEYGSRARCCFCEAPGSRASRCCEASGRASA